MTTIARCLTLDQAVLIKSVLDGFGVPAFVPDELAAASNPVLFMGSMNSIRVQVDDADVAAARSILEQNGLPVQG